MPAVCLRGGGGGRARLGAVVAGEELAGDVLGEGDGPQHLRAARAKQGGRGAGSKQPARSQGSKKSANEKSRSGQAAARGGEDVVRKESGGSRQAGRKE